MSEEEYIQISAFLLPKQWEALGEVAKNMGISSRQPLLRWAIDAFLLSRSSTYRTIKDVEEQSAEPVTV
jgi:hypothetical protein